MKKNSPLSRILFTASLVCLLWANHAYSATPTWLQTGTSDWNTPANWTSGSVPGAADSAIFNGTPGAQPTSNLSSSDTISNIFFSTAGWTISSAPGAVLGLSSTGNVVSGGAVNTFAAIVSSGTGSNTISAPILLTGGAGSTQMFYNGTSSLSITGSVTSTNAISLLLSNAVAGNNMNLSGNIGGGASGAITLLFDTTSVGNVTLSGSNTFAGVTFTGGAANLTYLVLNNSAALGTTGTITFNTGSGKSNGIEYTASNTTDYSNRFVTVGTTQNYSVNTNGQNVTWATALTHGPILSKNGMGTLTLANSASTLTTINDFAGTVDLNGGTVPGGSTFNMGGGVAGTTSSILLGANGAPSVINYIGTVDSGATVSGSGTINVSGGKTWSVTRAASTGADLTVSAPVKSSGALTKTGVGTLALTNAGNTLASIVIGQGVVQATALANGGVVSSIGNGSSAATNIVLGTTTTSGTLSYIGSTNVTTNRLFSLATGGGGLDASGVGTVDFASTGTITNGAGTASNRVLTLSGTNTGSNILAAVISDAGGTGGTTSVTKTGAGTWVLANAGATPNTYTGVTAINAGRLVITGSGYSGGVTVGNGSAVATLAGTGAISGALTAATASGSNAAHIAPGVNTSGSNFGVAGTLNLGSNGFTVGNGTNFDFDLTNSSSGNNDSISMNGGALTIGGLVAFNFNLLNGSVELGSGTTSAYILIDGFNSSTGFNASNFTTTGLASNIAATFTDDVPDGALYVTFALIPTPAVAYFNGQGNDLNTTANYDTSATSNTPVPAAVDGTSNIEFAANRNGSTTPNVSGPLTVNSVTFGAGTGGTQTGFNVSATGTGSLTIMASSANGNTAGNGITLATGGGSDTISAPVVLGASQSWTVTDSSSTLTVSGQVSGTGFALTKAGLGALALTNATGNTYTGGTAVNAGKLLISNTSGSAIGTGQLTVAGGATFGGAGLATGLSSFAIGNSGSGLATVQVGNGTDATSTLGLQATGASSIANTNLTFNLDSANTNSNQLNIGSTSLALSNSTLTLNLLGSNIIPPDRVYTLIDGTSNGQYSGLTLVTINGQQVITGGLSLTFSNSLANTYYTGSYLFLNNGDINVEVVPEPSTWAMIIAGLVFMVGAQRSRRRRL